MAFETPTDVAAFRRDLMDAERDLVVAKGNRDTAGARLDSKLAEMGLPPEFDAPAPKKAAPKKAAAKKAPAKKASK